MAASVRDSTLTTASSTSISATKPTVANGDILVAWVVAYGSVQHSGPSGWTQLAESSLTTPFTTGRASLWVKDDPIAGGEPSTFTWGHDVSDSLGVIIVAVADADTDSPVDGTVPALATTIVSNDTTIDAPAVSPSGSDSLLLCFFGCYPNAGNSPPSWTLTGLTELEDGGTWDHYAAGYQQLASSGSTGTRQGQTANGGSDLALIAGSVAIATGGTAATPVEAEFAQTAPAFSQAASVDATATVAAAQAAPAFTQAAAIDVDEAFTPDVVDEFDRADNPSLGGDWDILNGLLGIEDERAYVTTAGFSIATLDCGSSNGEVRLDVPVLGGEWWLIFRLTDVSNYWRFGTDGSNDYAVQAIVAAGIAVNIDTGVAPQAGDRLSVVADGRDLDFQVNGVSVATVTQSFNAHATDHGIAVFSPGGDAAVRFERFAMQTAPTVVQTPGVVVDDFEVDDGPLLAAAAGQRWQALQGDWEVDGGKARHTTSNGAHGQVVVDGAEPDGALTVNITLADVDTVAGVVVRGIDEMNHILIEPTVGGPGDENKIGVYKREGGTYSAIVDQPMSLVPGATHDLTIWVDGDHFVVRLDGDFLFDFTLDPEDAEEYASGTLVGLYSHRQATFDDGTTRFNSFQWLAGVGAPVIAALAQTAPAFAQSAGVEVGPVEATIAQTAPAFEQAAAVEVDTDPHGPGDTVTAALAQAAPAFTQAASATVGVSAAVGQTAPAFTQATDVGVTVTAEVGQQAPAFTQGMAVDVTTDVTVELEQTAPAFRQSVAFESSADPGPSVWIDLDVTVGEPTLRPAFDVGAPRLRWDVGEPRTRWQVGEPSLVPDRSGA